jgi:hypothetical protein
VGNGDGYVIGRYADMGTVSSPEFHQPSLPREGNLESSGYGAGRGCPGKCTTGKCLTAPRNLLELSLIATPLCDVRELG